MNRGRGEKTGRFHERGDVDLHVGRSCVNSVTPARVWGQAFSDDFHRKLSGRRSDSSGLRYAHDLIMLPLATRPSAATGNPGGFGRALPAGVGNVAPEHSLI